MVRNKCTATMYLNPPLQVLSVKAAGENRGKLQSLLLSDSVDDTNRFSEGSC